MRSHLVTILAVVAAIVLLGGVYWLGQRSAADRERALLAQLRQTQEQYQADRKEFIAAIRDVAKQPAPAAGMPPITLNMTLPSFNVPAQTHVITTTPGTVRIETVVTQPVLPEQAQKAEAAGAKAVSLTIKPVDLRDKPENERRADAVEDTATGAFVCVEGTLCEVVRTRQTIARRDAESVLGRSKAIAGFPSGFGYAYEIAHFNLPFLGRFDADALLFAWPRASVGAGLSKALSPSFGIGAGLVAGQYSGAVVYGSFRLP